MRRSIWDGIFSVKGKSERTRETQFYEQLMFPYGDKQKQWEKAMIDLTFEDKKADVRQNLYFCYLTLREAALRSRIDSESNEYENYEVGYKDWLVLCKNMWVKEKDRKTLEQLVEYELTLNNENDFENTNNLENDIYTLK